MGGPAETGCICLVPMCSWDAESMAASWFCAGRAHAFSLLRFCPSSFCLQRSLHALLLSKRCRYEHGTLQTHN